MKLLQKTLLIFLLLFLFSKNVAQAQNSFYYEKSGSAGIVVNNMCTGALISGIGSVINKPKEVKWYKAFTRGVLYGSVGGYIQFQGKQVIGHIGLRDNPAYGWLGKGVFFAGSSLIENAAAYRKPFELMHFNVAFVRLEVNTKEKIHIQPKLLPFAFGGLVYSALQMGKFDAKLSLQSGTPVFTDVITSNFAAEAMMNNIMIAYGFDHYTSLLLGHESVHTLQYESYSGMNNWLDKPRKKAIDQSSFAKGLYKWVYFDVNAIYDFGLYAAEGLRDTPNCYYNNYFEYEAMYLAIKRPIEVCK